MHPRIRVRCHAVRGTMAQVESSLGECSYAVSVYGSPIMSPDQFNGYGYGDGRVASHRRTMLPRVGCAQQACGTGGAGRYADSTPARVRMSAVGPHLLGPVCPFVRIHRREGLAASVPSPPGAVVRIHPYSARPQAISVGEVRGASDTAERWELQLKGGGCAMPTSRPHRFTLPLPLPLGRELWPCGS